MLFALVRGAITGLLKQLGVIVGVVVAILFTNITTPLLSKFLTWVSSGAINLDQTLLYAITFVIIVLLIYILSILLHKTTKFLKIVWLDRIGGALFCSFKYAMIVSLLLNIYQGLCEKFEIVPYKFEGITYDTVLNILPSILSFSESYGF